MCRRKLFDMHPQEGPSPLAHRIQVNSVASSTHQVRSPRPIALPRSPPPIAPARSPPPSARVRLPHSVTPASSTSPVARERLPTPLNSLGVSPSFDRMDVSLANEGTNNTSPVNNLGPIAMGLHQSLRSETPYLTMPIRHIAYRILD